MARTAALLTNPLELIQNRDFYHEVSEGNVPGYSLIHKFGAGEVTTTLAPISELKKYETPIAPVSLEIVSTSASDTAAGLGAQSVFVEGVDANWNIVQQIVATSGGTGAVIPTSLIRLHDWYVYTSGTYATATAGSHVGILTIQVAGGGAAWSSIPITPFPQGESKIGAFTIPTGYTGWILRKQVYAAASKNVSAYFFHRPHADDVVTPFSGAMRVIQYEVGVGGAPLETFLKGPRGPYVGPCDIGYMASIDVGTAPVSCEFELLLIQDGY